MSKKDVLWEKVKREFPQDPALQEVHYARLRIQEETKRMSAKEYIKYIRSLAKRSLTHKTKRSPAA